MWLSRGALGAFIAAALCVAASPAASGQTVLPVTQLPVPSPLPAGASRYNFVPFGAAFSLDRREPTLVDPDVFVQDPHTAAGTGLEGIHHAAAFREAYLSDDPASSLANANGEPLAHNLATWLGARGYATLVPSGGGVRIVATFVALISAGHYSMFDMRMGTGAPTYAPLDGTGTTNDFVADPAGRGVVTTVTPRKLTHDDAIVLVYHSDARAHGSVPGSLGLDAHDQLIVRLP